MPHLTAALAGILAKRLGHDSARADAAAAAPQEDSSDLASRLLMRIFSVDDVIYKKVAPRCSRQTLPGSIVLHAAMGCCRVCCCMHHTPHAGLMHSPLEALSWPRHAVHNRRHALCQCRQGQPASLTWQPVVSRYPGPLRADGCVGLRSPCRCRGAWWMRCACCWRTLQPRSAPTRLHASCVRSARSSSCRHAPDCKCSATGYPPGAPCTCMGSRPPSAMHACSRLSRAQQWVAM